MKPTRYHIIIEFDDGPHLLGLSSHISIADAKQAISWQQQGGNSQPMHICTYDKETRNFVDDAGQQYAPENRIYTKRAWKDFLKNLDPAILEAGGFAKPDVQQPGL